MANQNNITRPGEHGTDPNSQAAEERLESGWHHYSSKEYFRAEEDFKKVLELLPDHVDTLYALGMTQQASGQIPEAVQTFEKVIQLLENGKVEDTARAHMLVRLAHGHISRMQTGDWNLTK